MTEEGVRAAARLWGTVPDSFYTDEYDKLKTRFEQTRGQPYFLWPIPKTLSTKEYVTFIKNTMKNIPNIIVSVLNDEIMVFARDERARKDGAAEYQKCKIMTVREHNIIYNVES